MKDSILGITIALIICCLISTMFLGINNDIQNKRSLIGSSLAINSDTLLIVRYSTYNDTFELSNGLVMESRYCENLIIK